MNELLPSRYAEVVHRLAAGIEPRDAVRDMPAGGGPRVTLRSHPELRAARPLAHAGGRWSIRYGDGLPAQLDLRIEAADRRYVPRRLRVPIVPRAQVLAAETAGDHVPAALRTWRPALYPGAAYPLAPSATGLRGRALRAGVPARWVRVEATLRGSAVVLWRAHGDDRGEFLLAIGPDPSAPAELPAVIPITVTVRAAEPAPSAPADPAADPLWDLPLETLTAPGSGDPVSSAEALPPDYDPGITATRDIDLVPGRIQAALAPFDLV